MLLWLEHQSHNTLSCTFPLSFQTLLFAIFLGYSIAKPTSKFVSVLKFKHPNLFFDRLRSLQEVVLPASINFLVHVAHTNLVPQPVCFQPTVTECPALWVKFKTGTRNLVSGFIVCMYWILNVCRESNHHDSLSDFTDSLSDFAQRS